MKKIADSGAQSLTDEQLLEALLFYSIPRKDTKPIAKALLNKFGSLADVFNAPNQSAAQIPGIGQASARYIELLSLLLTRGRHSNQANDGTFSIRLSAADDAALYLKTLFNGDNTEQVFMVCLNNEYRVLNTIKLGAGTAYSAHINLKDVARHALNTGAQKILLSHNHTAGGAAPGKADIDATNAVIAALSPLGITVADHIIITPDEYFSFSANGILDA